MKTDTIAAIATAMTSSGIGIIRISGGQAFEVIEKIFKKKNGEKIDLSRSHTVQYGYICDQDEVIDEVLVLIMKGPHSYTAEDTVEIDCHGGVLMMKKDCDPIWSKTSRAGRIYETGVFKWADRSVPGRSGHRCDQRPE